MFQDREDAATQLAVRLKDREYKNPIVLGIPRGGIVPAAILAKALNADLDVLLARKIRAPYQSELAIGAIGEDGEAFMFHPEMADQLYIDQEMEHQLADIRRRREVVSTVTEPISLKGRSVIITDDGVATGSTLLAGLHVVRAQQPFEIVVAVPVAPLDTLERIKSKCDEAICLHCPSDFWAIGQYYQDFRQVSDTEMLEIIRDFKDQTSFDPSKDTRRQLSL